MNNQPTEAIVYYQITLAVHVDLATERVHRVVELREEIHPHEADPAMVTTDDGLLTREARFLHALTVASPILLR